eukprot:TRINITY_DN1455_c0_g1_i1.p3 TRINITY_DN1455_c0_g1~~TRINITY_DN1455_c0_g1_i1.p3  ORF type:complete len:438 (+),score=48.75 TRINITY_DN1455_c0_g1_i1:51-1316(+)
MQNIMKEEVKDVVQSHKIVFVTQVPSEFTSSTLVSTFVPFGKIVDTLLLESKRQAFIEFEDPESAKKCIETYKGPMMVHMSHKTRLTHKEHSSPGKVLFIAFDKVKYPLTADLLFTSFMEFGEVRKVLIYNAKEAYYALLEMDSIESAKKVKDEFNGKDLFTGGNSMNITYSKTQNLEIKAQNDKCKDYTLGFSEEEKLVRPKSDKTPSVLELLEGYKAKMGELGIKSSSESIDFVTEDKRKVPLTSTSEENAVLFVQNISEKVNPDKLFTLFACFGNVDAVRILESKKGAAMVQMSTKAEAETAKVHLNGCPLYGKEIAVSPAKIKAVYKMKGTIEYKGSKLNRYYKPGSKNRSNIAVVFVIPYTKTKIAGEQNTTCIEYSRGCFRGGDGGRIQENSTHRNVQIPQRRPNDGLCKIWLQG